MSKRHYNEIMNKGLESRLKPSNPSKYNNFVGRGKDLKIFVGNFTYECNFMILEDTTSIIDHRLGELVFGKPFARDTGLVYNQEEGTVTFEKDNKKITFKMPHKMEMFNQTDFKEINTDSIPPFVLESNDDRGKTYYSDSLTLVPEYREDESISKEIRQLMKLEREAKRHKGEVTLFELRSEQSCVSILPLRMCMRGFVAFSGALVIKARVTPSIFIVRCDSDYEGYVTDLVSRGQAVMSSASSVVTYTSVYTDSEPGRVFWGADEELSDGGSPRVIVHGYDGFPMQPVAPPSPDYIPGPEEPHTLPVPQDEDERYVVESDPEEDPEEYEDDETEDGPDEGEDAEEVEEHLAPADSAIVVPTVKLVSRPEGTKPVTPTPSTNITITRSRITVLLQASISLPPEAEVERLLAMPTPPPSPPISLSPPSAGERLARFPAAIPSLQLPPLPPSLYIPPPVDRRDDIPESERPPHKRSCLFALGPRYKVEESSTARPLRDPAEAVPEIAPMTMGEVNTRVTELAELHEHDT
ncbi:hypothetical protein Tco_0816948 [Tanacetum coccineum]